MNLTDSLNAHIAAVSGAVDENQPVIDEIVSAITDAFRSGHKLLACGNGGSAADSQHFVAEFINRMRFDRPPLPAIALTTDASVLTSIANDARYEDVFARQVQAVGRRGDVLVGFSTSGRSATVLNAFDAGVATGLTVVGFTGRTGATTMAPRCSLLLVVPSDDTPRVQESHEFIYHEIAALVERRMFDSKHQGEETR